MNLKRFPFKVFLCVYERQNLQGCSMYWPSHCESQALRLKCQPSPSEIDNNYNEDIVSTAVKCSSTDGIHWNLPLALGVGGSPDNRDGYWRTSPWLKTINCLMEIVLYEVSGHMPVGSPRGHLLTIRTKKNKKNHTFHWVIPTFILL